MKVLAYNLPAYHRIPENDEWWGEGFTEWDNVRRGKPLYKGHVQPMVPLNGYYYDLSKKEDVVHQAELAKEYGLGGFVYYHYWFNGKLLLEKPVEIYRDSKEVKFDYCLCWANEQLWLINLVCPKIYIKFNLICLNINFDLISFVRV